MKKLTPIATGLLFLSGLSLQAQIVDFSDDFSSGIDGATWTQGGYATPSIAVNSGELTVSVVGEWKHAHHAYVQTTRNDFDFFNNTLQIDWTLGSTGLGTSLPYTPNPAELWNGHVDQVILGWGISGSATDSSFLLGGSASSLFLGVAFTEQLPEAGQALNLLPTVLGMEVSAIPTAISYILDGTNVTATLTGATFVDTSLASYTTAHGKNATDFSAFYLTGVYEQRVWQQVPISMSTDMISVTNAVPEPATVGLCAGLLSLGYVAARRRMQKA